MVGSLATVLHYDGSDWTLEASPLTSLAQEPAPTAYQSYLWGVGGTEEIACAVGSHVICKARGQGWAEIDALAMKAGFAAVAAEGSGIIIGGDRVLWRSADGLRWSLLDRLPEFGNDEILGGQEQPDGSAVFWGWMGNVVEVRDGVPVVYRSQELGGLGGAVALGPYLYVGGTTRTTPGVVVRTTRHQRKGK